MWKALLTLLFIHLAPLCYGQLTLISPQNRIVFQRSGQNEAQVPVSGLCSAQTTRIEARAEAVQAGQGSSTGWLPVDAHPNNGRFEGQVPLAGGWYQLFVRALNGESVIHETVIERVGVGEVFIVAGQSNAAGGHQANPGAADDRVSVVDWHEESLPEENLPLTFSQAHSNAQMAPFNPLHMWGLLGDRLTRRLNVPVLFLGSAYAGTSSEVWRISALGMNPGGIPGASLMPYRTLSAALDHYVRRTGIRAVLWHQGESDNGFRSQQAYFENVRTVIDQSRKQSGLSRLPWVVSRASYIGGRTDNAIIAGQNQLIRDLDQVWPGPETDAFTGPDDRFDGLHFGGAGLARLTDLWDKCLTNDFFNRSAAQSLNALPAAITTGSVVPVGTRSGQLITIPSVRQGQFAGNNQFVASLLTADGGFLRELGRGTGNPLRVQLPAELSTGQYRVRIDATNPAITGAPSAPFILSGTPPPTDSPNQNNMGLIRRIAYAYDAPTHGFNLFVDADGSTEVKLQRLNGSFAPDGWLTTNEGTYTDNFNYTQYYPPASIGVGGVEEGQYLISARRIGQPATEKSVVVTIAHGFRTILPLPAGQTPGTAQTIPDQVATLNETFTFPIPSQLITDDKGDARIYSVEGLPAGLLIDQNQIRGVPQQTGVFTVTLQVSDTKGLPVTARFKLTVLDRPAPTSPPAGVAGLFKVGYKYDLPSHGFQLLVNANGPVEARLQRLDGDFSPADWGPAASATDEVGYTTQRFYAPVTPGVGGVEPGRYLMSARLAGRPETTISSEVALQYGVFSLFTATPPTSPTAPAANPLFVSRLGYKYDAPSHGFDVLVAANAPVEIRIERTDGSFSPTDWQAGAAYTDQAGYTFRRFYAPLVPGVGGVEAGTYQIKARISGDAATEVSVEVVLQYGVFQAFPPQKVLRQPTIKSDGPLTAFPLFSNDPNCQLCIPLHGKRLH